MGKHQEQRLAGARDLLCIYEYYSHIVQPCSTCSAFSQLSSLSQTSCTCSRMCCATRDLGQLAFLTVLLSSKQQLVGRTYAQIRSNAARGLNVQLLGALKAVDKALFSNWNFLGSPPLSGCSAKTFLPQSSFENPSNIYDRTHNMHPKQDDKAGPREETKEKHQKHHEMIK